jgi:ankyrin repeat protein
MKKAFIFNAVMFIIFLGCLLMTLIGCKSVALAPDIWNLLQRGDSRAKDYFLSEVEVNAAGPDGKRPLHYAAERGDAQLASFFIALGANPNVLDDFNQSPLGICVEKDNAEIAAILAAGGADIHLLLQDNKTAASLALESNPSVFKALLTPATIASVDSAGKNVLHLASIAGKIQAVTDILGVQNSPEFSINALDNDGKNALDYALGRPDSRNHMVIAEQLILARANSDDPKFVYLAPAIRSRNYNFRRTDGFAPIHYAVRDNLTGLLAFLFEKNADVNIKSSSGSAPLHEAARAGNIRMMTMLLDRGADFNCADALGNTPLHIGIPVDVHREAASLLLTRGANPNLRDEHGDTPLHIAIILNRPEDVIQTLLGGGSDAHIRNMQGKTPLYIAIQEKRTDIIPLLLSYGSEVFAEDTSGVTPFDLALKDNNNIFPMLVTAETITQRDSSGNTMLHAAVRSRGIPRHIGIILDQRVLVDARNRDGDTALHIAARLNQRENGEFLISRGADIFIVNAAGISPLYLALTASRGIRQWMINPTTIAAKDGLGNTMIHYAAQWKLDDAIPVIIQRGLSVNTENATGETPLFMAVKTNSPPTIRTLLSNRANLDARDKQGNSLLHTAVRWNAVESAALLISSGIDINAHSLNGGTALHDAVVLGMAEIETMLIKEKANLEARDIDGNTPFMEAVRAGQLSSIERLASNGADPSTRNIRGDTPLHIAVSMERVDVVNMLLRTGASIHARNTNNRTPFQNSLNKSSRMVSTLLTRNRINVPDDMGNSALHIALYEKASPEIIRVIINQGARVNAVDSSGKTPLRIAVDSDQLEMAKILADAGADPFITAIDNKSPADIAFSKGENCVRALFSGRAINAKDSSANTILHLAARSGTPETIRALIELGANKNLKNISSETPADIAVRWNRAENAELLR